jgi:hypothetical protein
LFYIFSFDVSFLDITSSLLFDFDLQISRGLLILANCWQHGRLCSLMAASCFIVRSIFAVGLAVGAGVVIGGGLTGCVV